MAEVGSQKLVVVTPAGRERYLRVLARYVLASDQVAEWHLWDNCRNRRDRAYVHALARSDPRCVLKPPPPGHTGPWHIAAFYRYFDDPAALYLRLDDDIVFVEDGFFETFKARALAARGAAFWFSPVVVNNALCNWLLQHLAAVDIEGPVSAQAMDPWSWQHAAFAEAMHPVLIEAARSGRLDCFRIPDQEVRVSRYSVNAIGFFGADAVALGERFLPPGPDEEEWLSAILPAKIGSHGLIFGDLLAAHFSFYTQERELLRTPILEAYYRLAGLAPDEQAAPRRSWLPAVFRRRRPRPGRDKPSYTISLPAPERSG